MTAFAADSAEPPATDNGETDQQARVAYAAALSPADVTGQPALSVPDGLVNDLPISGKGRGQSRLVGVSPTETESGHEE